MTEIAQEFSTGTGNTRNIDARRHVPGDPSMWFFVIGDLIIFGLYFVGIDAGADESASWAVVAARVTAVSLGTIVALASSRSLRPPRSMLPMLVAVGLIDTSANVLVAAATTYGAAGIVAVLSSLYPIVTMVLAWIVVGERLGATKRAGGVVAVAGAAFVAAG